MNDISNWDILYEHIFPFTLMFLSIEVIFASAAAVALLVKQLFK